MWEQINCIPNHTFIFRPVTESQPSQPQITTPASSAWRPLESTEAPTSEKQSVSEATTWDNNAGKHADTAAVIDGSWRTTSIKSDKKKGVVAAPKPLAWPRQRRGGERERDRRQMAPKTKGGTRRRSEKCERRPSDNYLPNFHRISRAAQTWGNGVKLHLVVVELISFVPFQFSLEIFSSPAFSELNSLFLWLSVFHCVAESLLPPSFVLQWISSAFSPLCLCDLV